MITYNDVFDKLQDYILNDENIQKSLKMKIFDEKYKKNNKFIDIKNDIKKNQDLFIPFEEDKLLVK